MRARRCGLLCQTCFEENCFGCAVRNMNEESDYDQEDFYEGNEPGGMAEDEE